MTADKRASAKIESLKSVHFVGTPSFQLSASWSIAAVWGGWVAHQAHPRLEGTPDKVHTVERVKLTPGKSTAGSSERAVDVIFQLFTPRFFTE